MNHVAPLVLMATLAQTAVPAPRQAWRPFKSPEGRFSVQMPADPLVEKKSTATSLGPQEFVVVSASSEGITYIVTYTDTDADSARESKLLLDGTRDLVLQSSKAKLITEKRLTQKRQQGREIRMSFRLLDDAKGGLGKCRIWLVGRRVYQLMAVGSTEKATAHAQDIDAFLTSFQPIASR